MLLFRSKVHVSLHLAMKFVFLLQIKLILVPAKRGKYLEWTNIHA